MRLPVEIISLILKHIPGDRIVYHFKDYISKKDIGYRLSLKEIDIENHLNDMKLLLDIKRHVRRRKIKKISSLNELNDDFIIEFQDFLDWVYLIYFRKQISWRVVEKCQGKINWKDETIYYLLEFLIKMKDYIHWGMVPIHRCNESIIDMFCEYFCWDNVDYAVLPLSVIRKHKELINWEKLSGCYPITTEFLEEFCEYFCWSKASYKSLPLSVIRKHKELIHWSKLSGCYPITMEFLEEFSDWLYWKEISTRQLTKEMVDKFKNNLDMRLVYKFNIHIGSIHERMYGLFGIKIN